MPKYWTLSFFAKLNLYLSPSSLPLVPLPCPATGQMMLSWSYSNGRLPELTSTMWSVLSIRKIGFELFQCRLWTAAGLTWTTSKAMRPTVRRVEVQPSTMTLIKAPPYYPSSAGTTTGATPLSPHSSHPQTQLWQLCTALLPLRGLNIKVTITILSVRNCPKNKVRTTQTWIWSSRLSTTFKISSKTEDAHDSLPGLRSDVWGLRMLRTLSQVGADWPSKSSGAPGFNPSSCRHRHHLATYHILKYR